MAKARVRSLHQPETVLEPSPMSTEARMSQLTSLALDLIERRLRDGTATSQETTSFLRYRSREAELKEQILEKQKELIEAKAENLRSQKKTEELYEKAIKAMRIYSGFTEEDEV